MSKRFLMPSDFWDTGLLEQWLEEKAAQGWMPVRFSGYSSGKFEKSQPQALRFRLEADLAGNLDAYAAILAERR